MAELVDAQVSGVIPNGKNGYLVYKFESCQDYHKLKKVSNYGSFIVDYWNRILNFVLQNKELRLVYSWNYISNCSFVWIYIWFNNIGVAQR